MITLISLVSVSIGAIIGTLLRHLAFITIVTASAMPYLATCFVNLVGSFLIGFLFYIFNHHVENPNLQLFLMTGLLGSLTTFSTFSLDAVKLILEGQLMSAFSYLLIQVILGVSFCFLGVKIAQYFYR